MTIKHSSVRQNFIYPQQELIKPAYKFGSGQLDSVPLKEDGDWRGYTPRGELQNRHGVESSACYVEASQHAVATIQEEQFNLVDQNYQARFNALLSNGTEDGGDPIAGAESIRHDGLIPEDMFAFTGDILSWLEYHSWKGGSREECIRTGQEWLKKWKPKYDIVFERTDSIEDKYSKLKDALKYSPVPMSVSAWYERDGIYVKPQGARDNHLVLCVYVDGQNRAHIFDTYEPFIKVLEPNFNAEFAMRWSLTKLDDTKISLWQKILNWLRYEKFLWNFLTPKT